MGSGGAGEIGSGGDGCATRRVFGHWYLVGLGWKFESKLTHNPELMTRRSRPHYPPAVLDKAAPTGPVRPPPCRSLPLERPQQVHS